jgi:hypothetical protein
MVSPISPPFKKKLTLRPKIFAEQTIDVSPEEAHQGPHQPSPRRSEYLGDCTGDFFVKSPSFCRLLEVNAARSQAIDYVLRAESLQSIVVGASADLDLRRKTRGPQLRDDLRGLFIVCCSIMPPWG